MSEEAPKRSAGRWLVIVGGVGAVIGLVCCGGYAASVGGSVFAFRGVFTSVIKGMFAPGTKAMQALGCQPAMVLDGDQFTEAITGDFERWGVEVPDGREPEAMPTLLLCQVSLGRTVPDPAEVARVYVAEVHPTDGFLVMVQGQFGGMQQSFDATGAALGPAQKR